MIFAFTIMEAVVAVIILGILIGLGVEGYKGYQRSRKITVGRWTTAPTSIPASPGVGNFVYQVVIVDGYGTFKSNVPAHAVNFKLTPDSASAGAVKIVSVTDAIGNVNPPTDDLNARGVSDAGGTIYLVLEFETQRVATITASDAATGKSDPSDTVSITAQ